MENPIGRGKKRQISSSIKTKILTKTLQGLTSLPVQIDRQKKKKYFTSNGPKINELDCYVFWLLKSIENFMTHHYFFRNYYISPFRPFPRLIFFGLTFESKRQEMGKKCMKLLRIYGMASKNKVELPRGARM